MLLFLEKWGELKINVESVKDWPPNVWKIAEVNVPKVAFDIKILVSLAATISWWFLKKEFTVKFGVHIS